MDCFVACAPRNDGEVSVDVHLQAFLLDDGGELRCLRLDEIGKLLRRAVIGSCAHRGDIALGVLALEEDFDFLVEGVDDRRGRALGRKMPNQDETSNLASSGALSRMVGISGAEALRSGVVTANPLSLPSWIWRNEGQRVSNRIWMSFPSAACSAGPAPRNGTCTIFKPVSCRNQTPVRCGLCPTPEEP